MRRLLIVLLFAVAPSLRAQAAPRPMLVELDTPLGVEIADAYSPTRERLWCLTEWTMTEFPTYTLVHVTRAYEEPKSSSSTHMSMDGSECRRPDKKAYPMLHSHPRRICQPSPADLVTTYQRMAPFDGVLCGEGYIAWYFYRSISAEIRMAMEAAGDSVTVSARVP